MRLAAPPEKVVVDADQVLTPEQFYNERLPQVDEARDIVTGEVAAYLTERSSEAVAPTVAALRTRAKEVVDDEMARLERRTPGLADADRAEVQRAVDNANTTVSRAESIRKFTILPSELTEASGHLTPKMSIKRNIIVQDFAPVIDELYATVPTTQGNSLVL